MDIGTILLLIPLLPALGALVNGLRAAANPHGRKNKTITDAFSLGSTGLAALLATAAVLMYVSGDTSIPYERDYFSWIPMGFGEVEGGMISNFAVSFGFQLDTLSATMLLIVTWVGFLIHVYATGYMAHEHGYTRFFTYLNLFMFMMLLLVLGNNYLVMFVGWEGVGLCSYLLIGFYYDKTFAADAGKKAFITNRIGDFGFVLGLFLIFRYFGTADYTTVFADAASRGSELMGPATLICILLFVGACGKSAQIPLYVWLPDAMAGPTPVSALIHAATMVTAGVYMVVRSNVLFRISPAAMLIVAVVGALTAIFAATIGTAQTDIKKVLAYSTVSQLGFMFIAAGVGAFSAAIFHVMTHAFFKACLFLGSGSVIHGCSGEQDMRRMGGLRKYMPKTHWTFLVSTIAIAGIPPLAGFFSKDEILASAFLTRYHGLAAPWSYIPILCWVLGMIAATLTAFYMFRLYYMTFLGEYRGNQPVHHATASEPAHAFHDVIDSHAKAGDVAHGHVVADAGHHGGAHGTPHESPPAMTVVLAILAFLAIVGGLVGPPLGAFGGHPPNAFQQWIEPVLLPIEGKPYEYHHAPIALEWMLILLSIAVAVTGILIARKIYGSGEGWPIADKFVARFPTIHRVVANKYYVDEIYHATAIRGTILLSDILAWFDVHIVDGIVNGVRHLTVVIFGHGSNLIDKYLVDGAVNGVASGARGSSVLLRKLQSGLVQNYALVMGSGVVFLVAVYLVLKP